MRSLALYIYIRHIRRSAYDNVGPEVKVSAAAKLCECYYTYERVYGSARRRRIPPLGAPCTFLISLCRSSAALQKTRFAAALESIKTKLMTIMYDYARRIYIYAPPRVYMYTAGANTHKKRLNPGAEINFANSTGFGVHRSQREFHTLDLWALARRHSFSTSVADSACFSASYALDPTADCKKLIDFT